MTTATFQIGATMSYEKLVKYHYGNDVNIRPSITRSSADYGFDLWEHVVLDKDAYTELQRRQEDLIKERNLKYEARREYGKMDKDLNAYFDRKSSSGQRGTKGKQSQFKYGNSFPIVIGIGNIEEYERLCDKGNVDEKDLRAIHINALHKAVDNFNQLADDKFDGKLQIDEYYMHADEDGVPHIHARMLFEDYDSYGNPSGNLGSFVRKVYGEKYLDKAMSLFREDVDKSTHKALEIELDKYALDKGVNNDLQFSYYKTFRRKGITENELTEREYKVKNRTKNLDDREKELTLKEKRIDQKIRDVKDDLELRVQRTRVELIEFQNKLLKREKDIEEREAKLESIKRTEYERGYKDGVEYGAMYNEVVQMIDSGEINRDRSTGLNRSTEFDRGF